MPIGKPQKKIRVMVVDDHPIVREGVRRRIEAQADMAVCCEVGRSADAMAYLQAHAVDIAIVDISLEGRSGIDLIKQIRASKFAFPILVLSIHDEVTYAQRALTAGSQGYLLKSEAPGQIIKAVRAILAGEFFISGRMASKLFAQMNAPGFPNSGIASLSDRELEILESVGGGQSTRQIASSLSLSISTIETYKHRLKIKLALDSAAELATYATAWITGRRKE
jgi:DNA-binding NarL/FixJ family response regulator